MCCEVMTNTARTRWPTRFPFAREGQRVWPGHEHFVRTSVCLSVLLPATLAIRLPLYLYLFFYLECQGNVDQSDPHTQRRRNLHGVSALVHADAGSRLNQPVKSIPATPKRVTWSFTQTVFAELTTTKISTICILSPHLAKRNGDGVDHSRSCESQPQRFSFTLSHPLGPKVLVVHLNPPLRLQTRTGDGGHRSRSVTPSYLSGAYRSIPFVDPWQTGPVELLHCAFKMNARTSL